MASVCGACSDEPGAVVEVDTRVGDPDVAVPDVTPDGVSSVCGNGVEEPGERCDDGPRNGSYGLCAADCSGVGSQCGDSRVDGDYELCDEGALNGTYGHCSAACNGPAAFCGNGFTEPEGGEVCDDGERNGGYGYCKTDCKAMGPACGDGVADDPFELCDLGVLNGTPDCPEDCGGTTATCGDGHKDRGEGCDDGERNGTYGSCASDCSGVGASCGDGIVQKPERCDEGVVNGTYGHCRVDCLDFGERCGDGVVQPPEVCDDGAMNGEPDACRVDCVGPSIGWDVAASMRRPGPEAGCRADDWFSKYLAYRKRFRGDGTAENPGFLIHGEGRGTAMPASRRQPGVNCNGYWEFGDCPQPDLPDARGLYKWGDGTSWLGHYFDVLAMEYAMFKDMGYPVDETLLDLKQALAAYIRLDLAAEGYFDKPGVRDGFYLRDDLAASNIRQADGSYQFQREDGFAGYECIAGDIVCHPPEVKDGSYTSQDQSIALMHGLALVARLVPDDVVVEGMGIRHEARRIAHEMTMGLRDNGWRVEDPNGDSPPDAWGGNAIGFSNHLALAANAVCGDDFGVDDYRNLRSRTAGEASWLGLQVIWGSTNWFNRVMAFKLASVDGSWDGDKMVRKALGNGSDYYAMTWAIHRGATLPEPWSDWRLEALLDSAPCDGPCVGEGCLESPGWRGESRVLSPGDVEGSRHVNDAELNGMDYMAYYSAYYLYKKGHVGFTVPQAPETCTSPLDGVLSGANSYDPKNVCAAVDMGRRFCGRPWANWLDDAYGGKVTIVTGGRRWRCAAGQACTLSEGGETGDDDLVIGTSGNDELEGDGGNDCLVGLGGDDILEGNQGYDRLEGGEGNDQLYGESGNIIVVDGEADILWAGPGNDTLKGGPGDDWMFGEEGDDELDGDVGSDALDGGDGNDALYGNEGDDRLRGSAGDDRIDCGWGEDNAWGGPGRDKIDGDLGSDAINGGTGNDFMRGGMGDDTIADPGGADRFCGNGGDDTFWADWAGDDQCNGGGWLFGGKDNINGCDDETASTGDCDKGAYDAW